MLNVISRSDIQGIFGIICINLLNKESQNVNMIFM